MSEFDPIAFGRLSERVEVIGEDMKEVKAALKVISATMERQRGAKWAFGTIIALISSGATSAIHQLFGIGK